MCSKMNDFIRRYENDIVLQSRIAFKAYREKNELVDTDLIEANRDEFFRAFMAGFMAGGFFVLNEEYVKKEQRKEDTIAKVNFHLINNINEKLGFDMLDNSIKVEGKDHE
jgi:hypothetical protein